MLKNSHLHQLRNEGYFILNSFFSEKEACDLQKIVSEYEENRNQGMSKIDLFEKMGWVFAQPKIYGLLCQVFGGQVFSLHHLHAARHNYQTPGVCWHQDYEQIPHTNRKHLMVHLFMYLSGLNGKIGSLQILPKSHQVVCDYETPKLFGESELPGSLIIDNLPAGSIVMVHSALWHSRKKEPGNPDDYRFFVDASFCERSCLWPRDERLFAYEDIAKKKDFIDGGKKAHLFSSDCFFGYNEVKNWQEKMSGSVAFQKGV